MSETPAGNKTQVYLLASVVVLLLVIAAILIVPRLGAEEAVEPVAQQPVADQDYPDKPIAIADGQVTLVPDGTELADFAAAYYEAILAGDFETAFYMQPAHRQDGNSVQAFKEQIQGYAVTGYELIAADAGEETATVVIDQQTGFGIFENTWTFAMTDEGWIVAEKAVSQMK
jgi:hypothetical protein